MPPISGSLLYPLGVGDLSCLALFQTTLVWHFLLKDSWQPSQRVESEVRGVGKGSLDNLHEKGLSLNCPLETIHLALEGAKE